MFNEIGVRKDYHQNGGCVDFATSVVEFAEFAWFKTETFDNKKIFKMATFDEVFKLLKSSRVIRADRDDEDDDAPANVIMESKEMEDKMEYSIDSDPPPDALTESEEEEMDDDSVYSEYVPESSDLESSDEDSFRLPAIYPSPKAKLKWTSDMKAGVPSTLPTAASASMSATATSPSAASVSATDMSPTAVSASVSATAMSPTAASMSATATSPSAASVSATAMSPTAVSASVSATATSPTAVSASVSATAMSPSAASVSATATSPTAVSASVSATATSPSAGSVSATATSPTAATASVSATSNLAVASCRSGKPKRPCLYCGSFESNLKRHLKRKHSDKEQVQAALKLPPRQQAKAFDSIRKAGILNRNKELLGQGISPEQLIRERRQGNSKVVLCGGCNGFFSKKLIRKHKQKHCSRNESLQAETIDICEPVNEAIPEDFRKEILKHFRDNEVGNLCRTDMAILLLGRKLWAKSGRKKRQSIMGEMRLMGKLLLEVRNASDLKSLTGEELLNRKYYDLLEQAIESLVRKENGMGQKSALKLSVGYMLKRLIKMMKGHYIQLDEMAKSVEVDYFSAVLDNNWEFLFFSAELECERRRNSLRKPREMPLEKDICIVRKYILERMKAMLEDEYRMYDNHDFVELRNLIVSRLTMFNARRGGEPARLTLTEWQEAEEDHWIDPEMVANVQDPLEQVLIKENKLAYQAGKGSRKLVPVLIPKDTIEAVRKLVSERSNASIENDNPYLFPNTGGSKDHASGYNSIKAILASLEGQLERPGLLIADKFRHRASTIFALQDLPEEQRDIFYRHMGHSSEMNRNVYQSPLAIMEMTRVGGFLFQIDQHGKGIPNSSALPNSSECSTSQVKNDVHPPSLSHTATQECETAGISNDAAPDIPREATRFSSTPEPTTAKPKAVRRGYYQWNSDATEIVCSHFERFIRAEGTGSKGCLPTRQAIVEFLTLRGGNIFAGKDFDEQKKIALVKTKVFNERKKLREGLAAVFETV